jgi:hypothetical protein
MQYRNNPFYLRRYANNALLSNQSNTNQNIHIDTIKVTDDIPPPNNIENTSDSLTRKQTKTPFSVINFFKDKITIEEIILIGVIFILLEEGVEDEFLLLMLVYILIF